MSMRGQEFKARDKKVHKMTRDGLAEKNLAQGTQQRISGRQAEVSFGRERQGETAAGHRTQGRVQDQAHGRISSRQPARLQPQEPLQAQPGETGCFSDVTAPEIVGVSELPVSMREASDSPMSARQAPANGDTVTGHIAGIQDTPRTVFTRWEKNTGFSDNQWQDGNTGEPGKGKKSQAEAKRHLYDPPSQASGKEIPIETSAVNEPPATDNPSGQLSFKPGDKSGEPTKGRQAIKKRMATKFAAGAAKPESSSQINPEAGLPENGRLHYAHEDKNGEPEKGRQAVKKRMAAKFTADAARSASSSQTNPETGLPENNSWEKPETTMPRSGRLQFRHEDLKREPNKGRSALKKRMAVQFSPDRAKPESGTTGEPPVSSESGRLRFGHEEGEEVHTQYPTSEKKKVSEEPPSDTPKMETSRLHYGRSELPPEERKISASQQGTAQGSPQGTPKQQKRYEKAQQNVETAGKKLEKAQSKLPTRRHAYLQRQYDSGSGKVKHRLRFETEIIPEYEKPPLPKRAGKALGRTVKTGVILKAHQKIRETERDNVGVEAAHKAEFAAERAAGRFLRWNKRRLHDKPYREVRRAEKRLAKANMDMAYQKLLADNPELRKKAFSRWLQKQKLKQKYAAAAREAAKGAKHTTNVLTAAGQVIRALAQKIVAHKAVLVIVALAVLIVALSGSLFSSCSAMLTGVQSAIVSTCYVAGDTEIEQSELRYTELETDLQKNINSTETNYPDYDEYRYNIGEIGHNPYELMGYLSAAYGDFTYAQVEAELNRLFGEQYRLTREVVVETRTYRDENDEEQEYDWYILKTTLTVRSLSEIITASLTAGGQADRYDVYMQTCGNRQCYGNPFGFPWIAYVTSPYGYRIHPSSGVKDLHRGIDISVAAGTPIKAIQDGRVISAGNAGGYGLCVVIEGEDGYQSRYAHCSSLSVRTGQEVARGDTIAAVGSTGSSTGSHLHLEVTHNGQYLNPYYYVDNCGNGYLPGGGAAGGPDFPADPGAAMGDGSFAAMLAEAEKYLGFPYVWGGSSPSTSFDCSGFVSWVINHSGVGSVGRQTAQGLYNLCAPVSRENMQPGDLVFFTGTYSAATPVTHVGIYVGGGRMIHCGKPISYANINGSYWSSKFYSGGRLP